MGCFGGMETGSDFPGAVWDLMGRRWMPRVLRVLSDGRPHRFNELLISLEGISTTTLCTRLGELEKVELVERTFYAEIPPRVEYYITVRGGDLCSIICQLDDFTRKWESRVKIMRKKR